jgi:mRNA-degrading endonuclease RelE of RelBE toxin-antitoxin system
MAYGVDFTVEALLDLDSLSRREEALIRASIPAYLVQEPTVRYRKRKAMDANPLGARWELRLGELRVYYDIDQAAQTVRILRVGRKQRERVYLRGVATDLRE